jgi:hydrogenase nickel incorporation protein HypB
MVLSKVDLLPYVPFDAELAKKNARSVHPGIEIIETSIKGDGVDQWTKWLEGKLSAVKSGELVSA